MKESPMAMHTIKSEACTKRANPVRMYPSTTSITPLINGTPGTRYKTLVARAISDVVSKINAVEAQMEATNAETMKMF